MMGLTRRNVALYQCQQIDDKHRQLARRNHVTSIDSPFRARCLVCGESLYMLTNCHAAKHGYASKQEMIAAGKVELMEFGRRRVTA